MLEYEIVIWTDNSDNKRVIKKEVQSQKELIEYLEKIDGFIVSISFIERRKIVDEKYLYVKNLDRYRGNRI